ncbi:MAG: addiction module protein [Ignavibacteria bacterium]|nr:addiction module protein [Ignavibacteria bacterium]
MDSKSIIKDALNLSPAERILILEALSKSLSEPNKEIDEIWKEEVEQRYKAFVDGKIKTIPYDEIIKKQ